MSDEEELDCASSKRKTITWTPNAWLKSLGHHTGFSTFRGLQQGERDSGLDLRQHPIPGTADPAPGRVQTSRMPVQTLRSRRLWRPPPQLHTTRRRHMDAHEHILTALQRLFTKSGYRTDRKNVAHSRGLKKADSSGRHHRCNLAQRIP